MRISCQGPGRGGNAAGNVRGVNHIHLAVVLVVVLGVALVLRKRWEGTNEEILGTTAGSVASHLKGGVVAAIFRRVSLIDAITPPELRARQIGRDSRDQSRNVLCQAIGALLDCSGPTEAGVDLPRSWVLFVIADHVHLKDSYDGRVEGALMSRVGVTANQTLFLGVEEDKADGSRRRSSGSHGGEALGDGEDRSHTTAIIVSTGRGVFLCVIPLTRGG